MCINVFMFDSNLLPNLTLLEPQLLEYRYENSSDVVVGH